MLQVKKGQALGILLSLHKQSHRQALHLMTFQYLETKSVAVPRLLLLEVSLPLSSSDSKTPLSLKIRISRL